MCVSNDRLESKMKMMFDIVVRIRQSLVCSFSTLFPFYGCREWGEDSRVIGEDNKQGSWFNFSPALHCSPPFMLASSSYFSSTISSIQLPHPSFNQEWRALSLYTHSPSSFYQFLRLFFPKSKQGKHVPSIHWRVEWMNFLLCDLIT